jgi:hypothetical protein
MGMMLSRPLLINDKYCSVKYPSVNLEYDPAYPDLPCPHKHMELQQRLCEAVIEDFDGSTPTISVDDAKIVIQAVERWLSALPPVYRLPDADTRYDHTHKYLILQRLQTVVMGYSSIVSVLKTFITQTYKPEPKLDEHVLREMQTTAVETCIKLMDIAQQLADLYIPDYNKYFLIVFTPFDTAALLCSAVIHDTKHILPFRNEILQTIAKGLALIRRLTKVTKTGAVAESVIVSLVSKFNLTPEETSIFYTSPSTDSPSSKRLASSPIASSETGGTPPLPGLSPDSDPTTSSSDSGPSLGTTSSGGLPQHSIIAPATMPAAIPNQQFDNVDPFLEDLTIEQIADFDFGALEPVFDWSHVNLFENGEQVFDFGGAP